MLQLYRWILGHIDEKKWESNKPSHFYISKDNQTVKHLTAGKETTDEVVAGLTIIKRKLNGIELDHIWLCGVRKDMRGKGLFKLLIAEFKKDCTDPITVATYPKKWTEMYSWIQSKNGIKIKEESDGKCLFTIRKKDL
jgi:hypothetical protein